jgi:hypothetical protein
MPSVSSGPSYSMPAPAVMLSQKLKCPSTDVRLATTGLLNNGRRVGGSSRPSPAGHGERAKVGHSLCDHRDTPRFYKASRPSGNDEASSFGAARLRQAAACFVAAKGVFRQESAPAAHRPLCARALKVADRSAPDVADRKRKWKEPKREFEPA